MLFVTQSMKLLISLSRMRDFMGKNRVNKVCILIPNCHPGNKLKIGFWFVFKSFRYKIFTTFPKQNGGGWGSERAAKRSNHKIQWKSLKWDTRIRDNAQSARIFRSPDLFPFKSQNTVEVA